MRPLRTPNGPKHEGPLCENCFQPVAQHVAFYDKRGNKVWTWYHVWKGQCKRPKVDAYLNSPHYSSIVRTTPHYS